MSMNRSAIRDISRVLGMSPNTVCSELKKKEDRIVSVNEEALRRLIPQKIAITRVPEAESDEMWSFVQKKKQLR